jgi:3-dehydroquinate synthase
MDDAMWLFSRRWKEMEIQVHTSQGTYPIVMEHGVLAHAAEHIRPEGRVFAVTDSGVPEQYLRQLLSQFPEARYTVFRQGEESKNVDTWRAVLQEMLAAKLSRRDMVIALGGGVVGDLAGFAAASYMRGIRYVNIPTTVLSQIDSSIGGKTAVDLAGVKNCVGAFWQPSMVLIDPDTLTTLPARQVSNGLAEAVKEGMIRDAGLFELFEQDDYLDHLDEIIARCLDIKRVIVEQDEREAGQRKLLNFGHTYGHAYESYYGFDHYLHGECVAMGMMTILHDPSLRARLQAVLERLRLPASCDADPERIAALIQNDKKADHDRITIVQADVLGSGHLEDWTMRDIRKGLGI